MKESLEHNTVGSYSKYLQQQLANIDRQLLSLNEYFGATLQHADRQAQVHSTTYQLWNANFIWWLAHPKCFFRLE